MGYTSHEFMRAARRLSSDCRNGPTRVIVNTGFHTLATSTTANMPSSSPCEKAERRALTAAYIVALYQHYLAEDKQPSSSSSTDCPTAPIHVSPELSDDCERVARVLANAVQNQCQW